jgi:hypothetical protein
MRRESRADSSVWAAVAGVGGTGARKADGGVARQISSRAGSWRAREEPRHTKLPLVEALSYITGVDRTTEAREP